MRQKCRQVQRWASWATLFAMITAAGLVCAQGEMRYSVTVDADYEDVVDDVRSAIADHNFRITGGNDIGGAIGKRHEISFPRSEVVHFCNLEYARKFVELAPAFVGHMPCKVVIYELAGRVVVETRMLPDANADVAELVAEVNDILRAIVDDVTQ